MATPTFPRPSATFRTGRRAFLRSIGGSALSLIALPACGYYPPESCDSAYDPWSFPETADDVRLLLVQAATLAASPHNTQPWRFRLEGDRIDVFADLSRNLGAMDSQRRELYISLGCALENMRLAARHHGKAADIMPFPSPGDETHVASLTLAPAEPETDPLYPSIPARRTNRGRYLETSAPDGLEEALRAQISEAGVALHFFGAPEEKALFRRGTIDATRAIVADREMNEASHAWWRQTCDDIERHRDGLTLDCTGNDALTRFLGKLASPPDAATAGDYWISLTEDQQTTGSGFVVLSTPDRYAHAEQLRVGRAFQRIHLWATTVGLALQPLNQMAERQDRELSQGLPPRFTDLLARLLGADRGAQMSFRIGYAWDAAFKSPRRPVAWVLS